MTVSQIVYSLCVLKFAEAEALVEECLGRHRQGGSVVNPPELVDAVACKVVLDVRQRGLSLDVYVALSLTFFPFFSQLILPWKMGNI